MPDRDNEIGYIEGTFDTSPTTWVTPSTTDTWTINTGIDAKPYLYIAAGGSPIEISSADTTLCRLELGVDGRWTAVYDPANVDEAARAFLDAVTGIGRNAVTPRGPEVFHGSDGPISPAHYGADIEDGRRRCRGCGIDMRYACGTSCPGDVDGPDGRPMIETTLVAVLDDDAARRVRDAGPISPDLDDPSRET